MAQPTGFEPASARSTIESFGLLSYGCGIGTATVGSTLVRATSERLPHAMVGVEGFEPSILRRVPGLRPGRATSRPNTPTFGGEGASRTRKSQRYVPLQTGSACHLPNLSYSDGEDPRRRSYVPRTNVPSASALRMYRISVIAMNSAVNVARPMSSSQTGN